MHQSSYDHMRALIERHLDPERELQILDIGACDVGAPESAAYPGSYRPLFDRPKWTYRGVDVAPGPNVDIVLPSAYRFPLASHSADVVVSGQAFEHIEFFWLTWLEMARVLKPCGLIFLIAPSRGQEHRYPVDCWRFYRDGFRALGKFARLAVIEASTDWQPHADEGSAGWGDTVGVFKKPNDGRSRQWIRSVALGLTARLLDRA
jgi:SAM-dependent methyltransferase